MDPIGLIVMLVVGAIAGWLAAQLMGRGGFGLVGNMLVGVAGAVIAGFLLPGILLIPGLLGAIVNATIGAVILLFVIGLLRR